MTDTKTAVITGANAGLGFATTRALAEKGYHIVMACRNANKANKARQQIIEQLPQAKLTILSLDVSEPESIHMFAQQFQTVVGSLDLLINNAGIAVIPLARNSLGYEMQLATNYLGAFLLTGLLLPFFNTQSQTRIVNVGSLAHRLGKLDFNDINWESTDYNKWKAYAHSKLALQTFTLELNRRLKDNHSHIIALGAHPGFAYTEIGTNNATLEPNSVIGKWFHKQMKRLIPSATNAAQAIILAATDANMKGGEYFGPSRFLEISGKPGKAKVDLKARDTHTAAKLWALSESLTRISYQETLINSR